MNEQVKKVRRKIGDRVKTGRDTIEGNGIDRIVALQHGNVWGLVVVVSGEETTDFTLESQSGRITFNTAPAQGASVVLDYLYAAYTDEDIEELIASEGGVLGASIAAIEELTMDTARFYDFTQGETSEKRSQVFKNLQAMLEHYKKERDSGADDEDGGHNSGLVIGKRTIGIHSRNRNGHNHTAPNASRRW